MTIKQLKKELGLSNEKIAEFFGMKLGVYANSTAKKRYEKGLINFYLLVKEKEKAKEKAKDKALQVIKEKEKAKDKALQAIKHAIDELN